MAGNIAATAIAAGVAGGYALGCAAARCLESMQLPDVLPVLAAAAVLSGATVLAALLPASQAAHGWARYRPWRGTRKPTTRGE